MPQPGAPDLCQRLPAHSPAVPSPRSSCLAVPSRHAPCHHMRQETRAERPESEARERWPCPRAVSFCNGDPAHQHKSSVQSCRIRLLIEQQLALLGDQEGGRAGQSMDGPPRARRGRCGGLRNKAFFPWPARNCPSLLYSLTPGAAEDQGR